MKPYMVKDNSLSQDILHVIRQRGTEPPFTDTTHSSKEGTYLCRACGLALFRTKMQFHSFCGWPSFDEIIENTVTNRLDPDGIRTEINCARCLAHLGHVFEGEGWTLKNRRYCVNSVSLDFVNDTEVLDTEEAIVAGGCFWGVEYYFNQLSGVVKTEVGYTGGVKARPSYSEVCTGSTGHLEALRVVYDCSKLDYKTVIQYFFEIHDPTQINGQGPDLGPQYQSAIFYYHDIQKKIASSIIDQLEKKGNLVATTLRHTDVFWPAESYHQQYYSKNSKTPYCHQRIKRF